MAFKDAVAGSTIRIVDLYRFTYASGSIGRFTSHEVSVLNTNIDANAFVPIYIERSKTPKHTDVTTGKITVIVPRDDAFVSTADLANGILDHGALELFQSDLDDPANYRLNFKGFVGDVNYTESVIHIVFLDEFNLLKKLIPRRVYSEACPYSFGDADCTIDLDTVKVVGTADAGSDADTLVDAARVEADGWFSGGYIEFTSGSNMNEGPRAVDVYTVGRAELIVPYPNAIVATDAYTMWPHCRKEWDGCDRFSNTLQFGAFQNIPRPEEIY